MYRTPYSLTPMQLALLAASLGAGWLSIQVYLALMAKRHPEVTGVSGEVAVVVGLGFLAMAYGMVSLSGDGPSTGYLGSTVGGAVLLVIGPLLAFRK